MGGDRKFEIFASTINDLSPNLPKGRGRCFDIGSNGGCGVTCAAFCDGECPEPQEIEEEWIIEEHGKEEALSIMEFYSCFDDEILEEIRDELEQQQ